MQLRLQAAGRPRDQEGQPGGHGGKSQEDLRRLYFDSETEKRSPTRVGGDWLRVPHSWTDDKILS